MMNRRSVSVPEQSRRAEFGPAIDGVMLLGAALVAVPLALLDPMLGVIPFLAVATVWLLRRLGVGRFVPGSALGWLFASTILVTCIAPSLGGFGSIVRFLLAIVAATVLVLDNRSALPRLPKLVVFGLALLILSLSASFLAAPSSGYGAARFVNWVMFIPLFALSFRRPNINATLFGLIATSIIQILGVGLQIAGLMGGTWGGLLTSGEGSGTKTWLTRYTGFLANPNDLGLLLSIGIIALTACLYAKTSLRLKVFCSALIVLFGSGVVLTGSRGALVAIVLGVLIVFVAVGSRGWVMAIIATTAISIFLHLSNWDALNRVATSFSSILGGTDGSALQRSAVWGERAASGGNYVLGNGFGGYVSNSLFSKASYFDLDAASARLATVDNSWLKLLLESGAVGVIGLGIVLVVPMIGALRKFSDGRRLVGIAAGAMLAAMLWRSFSVDILDTNPWNAIFFLLAGTALSSQTPRGHSAITPRSKISGITQYPQTVDVRLGLNPLSEGAQVPTDQFSGRV